MMLIDFIFIPFVTSTHPCASIHVYQQYWLLSKEGEIRRDESCVDYAGKDVVLYPCHGTRGNQLWIYDHATGLMRHGSSGKCLEMAAQRDKLSMRTCSRANSNQRWKFDNYDASKFTHLVE